MLFDLRINLAEDADVGTLEKRLDAAVVAIQEAFRDGKLEPVNYEQGTLSWRVHDRPSLRDRVEKTLKEAGIGGGVPLNVIGAAAATERSAMNDAVRGQLGLIAAEAAAYNEEAQMPHEWGSIDSFDDMRNALWVALELMDNLMYGPEDEEIVFIRKTIAERGICAAAEEVWNAAFPNEPDHEEQVEILFGMIDSGQFEDKEKP